MAVMYNYFTTVPSAPTVVVIPHYSYSTMEFVGLTVKFNQLVSQISMHVCTKIYGAMCVEDELMWLIEQNIS